MCPCTLVDRKQKHLVNAVDVVECLHDPTDPSTERMAPPCSAHVQLDDVPRALDLVVGRGRVPTARRRVDGVGDVIGGVNCGGGHRTRLKQILVCLWDAPYIKEGRRRPVARRGAPCGESY